MLASAVRSYCYPGGISDNSTSHLNLIVCLSAVLFSSCYSCFVTHFKDQYKLDQLSGAHREGWKHYNSDLSTSLFIGIVNLFFTYLSELVYKISSSEGDQKLSGSESSLSEIEDEPVAGPSTAPKRAPKTQLPKTSGAASERLAPFVIKKPSSFTPQSRGSKPVEVRTKKGKETAPPKPEKPVRNRFVAKPATRGAPARVTRSVTKATQPEAISEEDEDELASTSQIIASKSRLTSSRVNQTPNLNTTRNIDTFANMGDIAPANQNPQPAPPGNGMSLFGGVFHLTPEQLLLFNSKDLPKVSKTAPIFDKDVPSGLPGWIEDIQRLMAAAGINDEAVKVAKALEYMSHATREAYKGLDSVAVNPNLDQLIRDLRNIYLESAGSELGSRQELEQIVKRNTPIDIGNLEKILVYNRDFKVQADKLMKPPAILSNIEAVRVYIIPMTRRLVDAIYARLRIDVTPAELAVRRREDPYDLSKLMEAAGSLELGSLETFYGKGDNPDGPLGVPYSAETYSRGSMAFPFAPQIYPPAAPTVKQVKTETRDDQFNQIMATMAAIKDTITINKKESDSVLDSHHKTISSLMQTLKNPPESASAAPRVSYAGNQSASQRDNKVPDWGQGCFMCGSLEHCMSDCQFFNSYKDKGWLVPDTTPGSKKYTLRDGSPLPRTSPDESRPERIARIAKQKGWDKGGTNAFFVEEEDILDTAPEQSPHYSTFLSFAKILEEHEANLRQRGQKTGSSESGN